MRDEKEARSCNNVYITILYINVHVLMRDEKEARSNKQQGKATQHTQGSHFFQKNELTSLTTLHSR